MSVARTSVGVVGLGYVGLPLALAMDDSGYDVVGVDVDEAKIDRLNDGESTISDVSSEDVAAGLDGGIQFTTDYEQLSHVDGLSICVPTPLRKTDTPDLSYVIDASEQLARTIPEDCTIILESTVYPGATEEVVGPILAEHGHEIGRDVHLAYSPERIDPGNEIYGATEIPKVIGGVTSACCDRAEALYDPVFDEVVRVESATEAELVKLLENTFRAVNIALINELAQVANELDVDIWNVIDAAKTKPFGYTPFYPGPGLGGHCIPIDPVYLSWKAEQHGMNTRFIDLADTVNREMPGHVVQRVLTLLNERGTALVEANILVVGVAYKPGVSDVRESPAIDIISELTEASATVQYHDPHVPELDVDGTTFESVSLEEIDIGQKDCVVIVTDHSTVDVDRIVAEAQLVFDTRNATKGSDARNVIKL